MECGTYIGQLMGVAAMVLGFVSFQMHTQRRLLLVQTATTIAFCIHYYLIGAYSGLLLNLIGIARNLAYCCRTKSFFQGKKTPLFFAIIMGAAGLLSWQGIYTVFAVLGLVINTLCLAFEDPQKIRKSILITSPLVLIYDAFVFSVGGMIYESIAIVSAFIGIIQCNKEKTSAYAEVPSEKKINLDK